MLFKNSKQNNSNLKLRLGQDAKPNFSVIFQPCLCRCANKALIKYFFSTQAHDAYYLPFIVNKLPWLLFDMGGWRLVMKRVLPLKRRILRKRESIYLRGIVETFGTWMEVKVVYWGYLGLPPATAGWPANLHHVVTEAMTKRHAVRIIRLRLWGGSQLYL